MDGWKDGFMEQYRTTATDTFIDRQTNKLCFRHPLFMYIFKYHIINE